MNEPETFTIGVPDDGRLFPVGTRVRLGKNGDGETLISDPNGDLIVIACEPGLIFGTRRGLILELQRQLNA